MQDLMRKHRKLLMVVIVLTIGVPMLFFGIPAFWNEASRRGDGGRVVATVGELPVYEEHFRQALQETAARQAPGGTPPTVQELDQNGTAGEVLQRLIDQALFTHELKQRHFNIDAGLADERLKEENIFKDSEGNFDREEYNNWILNLEERGVNWNAIRADIQDSIARQVFVTAISAPAGRVFDEEIQRELEDNSTKIQMKYTKIEPAVDVTEEEIQKQYASGPDKYKKPDQHTAEFAAISLVPEQPAKVAEVLGQARGGTDFATLADQSDNVEKNGGDMDWVKPEKLTVDYQKVIAALQPGQVSDPVYGFNGYYIYKVDEERTNPDSGERELHARQLFIKAELTEEQRAEREAHADALLAKAKASGDLAAAAQEAGLQLEQAGPFDPMLTELAPLPKMDVRMFISPLTKVAKGEFAEVIKARTALYVARVTDVLPGTVPPLEEVRDKVREDALTAKKQTDEYQAQVKDYAGKIKEQAKTLEEIGVKFPELAPQIKTSSEFTKKDYLFQDQLFLSTPEIYDAIGHGEPGMMGGPFTDFQGVTYFVELVKKTPPAETEKADWDAQRKQIRQQKMMMAQRDLLEDYQLSLRQRLMQEVPIRIDEAVLGNVLNRDPNAITPPAETPAAAPAEANTGEEDAPPPA
ncbi:MAG: peptidyl-prolyl cis-trans isomerase [Candidatus Hydrogenedentes bacterium]|nr:peptidyl-prolyl cis-trans isomerase [Candidatus Hydrogenedentota bacterium]